MSGRMKDWCGYCGKDTGWSIDHKVTGGVDEVTGEYCYGVEHVLVCSKCGVRLTPSMFNRLHNQRDEWKRR